MSDNTDIHVSLTARELDIVAAFLYSAHSKIISQFLNIEPRTVETHIYKIMSKLECKSRHHILEKSSQLLDPQIIFKRYKKLCLLYAYTQVITKKNTPAQRITFCYSDQLNIEDSQNRLKEIKSDLENIQIKLINKSSVNKQCVILDLGKGDILKEDDEKILLQIIRTLCPSSILEIEKISERLQGHAQHFIKNINPLSKSFLENSIGVAIKRNSFRKLFKDKKVLSIASALLVAFLCIPLFSIWSTSRCIEFNIPKQHLIFIGREELLEDLHSKLHENKEPENKIAISACAGLGGIGKTQLALQYLRHTNHPYTLKAWFSAEHPETLHKQYVDFARSLGFADKNASTKKIINFIKEYLQHHPGWLIVYDNVTSYKEIEPFLPDKGGCIILTTRNRSWPENFKMLPIDVMNEKEAINTIQSLVKRNIDNKEKDDARELVKTLGYLPLALAQAGAYIYQNNLPIAAYLHLYKNYEIELLEDKTLPKGSDVLPVAVTWNISLDAIAKEALLIGPSPLAVEFLVICSYLSPDKISRKVLLSWLKGIYSQHCNAPELTLNKHIELLWRYSMINYDGADISIHRLVQSVLRHHFLQTLEGNKDKKLGIELNLDWYNKLLSFFIENENEFKLTSSFNQLLLTYNMFKSKMADHYNDELAELDLIITTVYFNQERYDDHLKLLHKINDYLQHYSQSKMLKARLLYCYSSHFRKMGDFQSAEKYMNQSLKIFKEIKASNPKEDKKVKNLKARILFNKANLCFAKNKGCTLQKIQQKEVQESIDYINESISISRETENTRDWLRSIELYGRLANLIHDWCSTIEKFNQHREAIEKISDDRTKMLFYLTYSDAYVIKGDPAESLKYCDKAKLLAKKLGLKNELNNIENKEKTIKNLKNQKL